MTIFLETSRLIIKAPELQDIDKIYRLDSDPDVMRYIGNGLPRSKEESKRWYVKSVQYYEKYGCSFGLVYEKATNEFVGRAGINHNAYDDSQPDIEIGYRLFKKFWNKGYGTELATELIQWGFKNLKIEKICGFAVPGNKASRHVLEKVGMKLIGNDKYGEEGVVRYEILKNDFMQNQGKRYDLIAKGFADLRNSFATEQKYIDLFMQYLHPGSHILDVGCGSGFPIASYLIDHGFEVTGVDASKELLKIAKEKCPTMKQIYGDVRTLNINDQFDGIIEWWCLFHLPKEDHKRMIQRFSNWIKPGGILEFTSGDTEYEGKDNGMLNQELNFYSLHPDLYEKALKENGFHILLKKNDQEQHLVWLAKKLD